MRNAVICMNCGLQLDEIDGDSELETHAPACALEMRELLERTVDQLARQTRVAIVWRNRYHKLRESMGSV